MNRPTLRLIGRFLVDAYELEPEDITAPPWEPMPARDGHCPCDVCLRATEKS